MPFWEDLKRRLKVAQLNSVFNRVRGNIAAFRGMLARSRRPHFLSPHTDDEYNAGKQFMDDTGKAGYFINANGDICNVVNESGVKGRGAHAVQHAITQGGKTLDCFDGRLPEIYKQAGMNETGRMKFNPDYKPEGWDIKSMGEPDVIFMAHGVPEPKTPPTFHDDFDTGKQASLSAWQQARIPPIPKPPSQTPPPIPPGGIDKPKLS